MKRATLVICVSLLASLAVAGEPVSVYQREDGLYVRSELDADNYLVRKVELGNNGKAGNQVVNFAGARVVPRSGDFVLNHGYLISDERDDIAPIKFNGTYIGANHGANFGVQIRNTGVSKADIGSLWLDGDGTSFTLLSAGSGSATFLSESDKPWAYKVEAVGFLKPRAGGPAIAVDSQQRAQIYPSVRRVSLSVDPATPVDELSPTDKLDVSETYDILTPGTGDRAATVEIRYSFHSTSTTINTKVTALTELEGFSIGGVQAAPLNGIGSPLMQKVKGSARFAGWQDISGTVELQRIPTQGASEMSQKSGNSSLVFGLTVGIEKALLNGKRVGPAPVALLSAAKKQYPIAIEPGTGDFNGVLHAGDVVEVQAYRRYWVGDNEK